MEDHSPRKKKSRVKYDSYKDYSREFNSDTPEYRHRRECNIYFLTAILKHAKQKLETQGYILLNEVYDMLGFPKTPQGRIVGWLKKDGEISFGEFENTDPIRLTFNVQGVIYDLI